MTRNHFELFPLLSIDAVLLLLGRSNHLSQLILLGELTGENTQVLNQVVTGCDHGVLGSDLTVGLDTQFKLGKQGVRDLNEYVSYSLLIRQPTREIEQ